MIRFILGMVISIVSYMSLDGQNLSIQVNDAKGKPISDVPVSLLTFQDSSLVKAEYSDTEGSVKFKNIKNGQYLIRASFLGYLPYQKLVVIKSEDIRLMIEMKENQTNISEVSIVARKPLVRQEDDKMIIDPEPIANTSTSSYEILEKTPGIYLDQDGNIYLSSATPATVYINGREQKMSASDIASILKNLPPNAIQRIEILRTPSAKYDASSSGGLVNVVLKKGVKLGLSGSINSGANQGKYGNQFIGMNLNQGANKFNYYMNMNYNHRDALDELNSIRFLTLDSTLSQNANTRSKANQYYFAYGTSVAWTAKLDLSYDGRINATHGTPFSDNINRIAGISSGVVASLNENHTNNKNKFYNIAQDFGAIYKLDSADSQLDTKISYQFNDNTANQNYNSQFLSPFSLSLFGNGENKTNRNNFLIQSDLTYKLNSKLKLETGLKSNFQKFQSDANYFILQNGVNTTDPLRTNEFKYREQIHAAYLQASQKLPSHFIIKAGLRAEHTFMEGKQLIPFDTTFTIRRTDLFPYVYLSRKLFSIAKHEMRGYAIYRQSISRPSYDNLNPAIKYIDQYLYETGNPDLNPQFTDNIEVNISFEDMPLFAVGKNYTRDIFSNVVYQDQNNPNVIKRSFDNIGTNEESYFRITGAIPPGGKYFFVVVAQYNLNHYKGLYENEAIQFKRGGWRFFTFHSLSLTKSTKLTMHGFMMVNSSQNFYELDNFGGLNFGLQQSFLKKKLTITLNAQDVLKTMRVNFKLDQGNILSTGDRYSDNQRFGINVRYNFGFSPKQNNKSQDQQANPTEQEVDMNK
ncbi:MAG: TonB-dependent receptor [Saprospiraceae bacterium]|nr:TonB-dependent receptor [Saprospiraceae bacterium]